MTNQLLAVSGSPSELLSEYREHINIALERFFIDTPQLLELDLSPISQDAIAKLQEYSLRPAKRIRGSLAAAAYDYAAKTQLHQAGIVLGVALELMQSYLLIVDDVMDRSGLRRGRPTIHQLYASEQGADSNDMHEANMLAVNVGLIAQHLANLAVLRIANNHPPQIVDALFRMHLNIVATGFGQIDDTYQQVGRQVTYKDLLRKYSLKSSYYTFINPLQAGLALAGISDEETYRRVVLFGEPAGIAFQLHDDFIGVFGEEAITGKPNLDDIKEGKYTMLVQYVMEHGTVEQIDILQAVIGRSDAGQADLIRLREVFAQSGAKAFVRQSIDKFANTARRQLTKASIWDRSFRELLADLVNYSVSRQV